MANSHCKGVRRVVGLRYFVKFQHNSHHFLHLLFLGSAVADNALLHLKRRVFGDFKPMELRRQHNNSPRLRNVNDCLCICVVEKLFNRHDIGFILGHYQIKLTVNDLQSLVKRRSCLGCYCAVAEHLEMIVTVFQHAVTDYRIAGVNS